MASDRAIPELPDRLGDAIRRVRQALEQSEVPAPDIEARRLVAHACGLAPIVLATEPARVLTATQKAALATVLARRLRREPLGRIAGEREFYGRVFQLSPGTLEPRADTETLVGAVLEHVADRAEPLRILDIGAGTGCILLTLLAELPHATGLGIDISPDALATAAANAARLGLADRAAFELRDGPAGLAGSFDIVVSNPPYIPSGDIAGLDPEVRVFDPHAALDGGADGLDFYRAWIPETVRLAPGGLLAMEVGASQADSVAGLMRRAARSSSGPVLRWRDLGGHTRVVAIKLHGG